jgi:hypothetical protein
LIPGESGTGEGESARPLKVKVVTDRTPIADRAGNFSCPRAVTFNVTRFSVIPPVALILIASGCFGSSTAAVPGSSSSNKRPAHPALSPLAYAKFQIHETYTTGGSTNHFGGDLHRTHFTLTCHSSERTYLELQGVLSRQARLCLAILDYRTQIPLQGGSCKCPLSPVVVDLRGTIRGRPVYERVTPCLCEDGPEAARDARVILSTRPPV